MTKVIYNPALASIEEHSATNATFDIELLHAGYGNTLGNSLRRVLLSSIQGAAVVAFRIEGASHEFTTIPGVKEDAIDIMLNIKNIRFKSFNDEPVELRLEKKGSGPVTAGDIKTNADVEVINPTQIICNIDDPKKSVVIDFIVERGRGYQTIEDSSAKRVHSDMIAVFTKLAADVFERSFGLTKRRIPPKFGKISTNMIWQARSDRDSKQAWLRRQIKAAYSSL